MKQTKEDRISWPKPKARLSNTYPLQIYVGDMFTVDYGKNIFKYFIKSRTNVSLFFLGKEPCRLRR